MSGKMSAALDYHIVRLEDPQFYLDDPYPVYRRLRSEAPVFWYEPLKCWVVSKQEDIRFVSHSHQFTASKGIIINEFKNNDQGIVESLYPEGAESLTTIDPPRQQDMRRFLQPNFGITMVKNLEPKVREIATEILDAIPAGEPIDWIERVSTPVPLAVICGLLGLREMKIREFKEWTDHFMAIGTETDKSKLDEHIASLREMKDFFYGEIEYQRKNPQGGVIATLVEAERGGEINEATVIHLCELMLVAGNDTTRHGLTGQMALLIEHPEQYRRLQEDPSLCETAANETVRFFTPTLGLFRVAREDLEIRGQKIKAGEPVYMLYASGNRDEDVYDNPDVYDVSRPRNPGHVGFGSGFHHCLGNLIARMEIKVITEEVVKRFSRLEPAGEPVRLRSVLNNGYLSLPVRLTRF